MPSIQYQIILLKIENVRQETRGLGSIPRHYAAPNFHDVEKNSAGVGCTVTLTPNLLQLRPGVTFPLLGSGFVMGGQVDDK
jgi:hypothetical protein